jgi:hypothetical protein
MLDAKTISTLEGILNEELLESICCSQCTIQDGKISNGKDWLGDKPRCNYALVIFQIIYDKDVFPDYFHLGSAAFISVGQNWRLQHYKIDHKMGI